jgi:AraC-like DNA-binding protein
MYEIYCVEDDIDIKELIVYTLGVTGFMAEGLHDGKALFEALSDSGKGLPDLSLLDISMSCGFSDPKYFNAWFERCYTVTPREFREEYAGTDLTEVGISPNSTIPLHMPEETALKNLKKYLGDNEE